MCDKKDAGMDWAERAVPESVGGPVPSPPAGRTWEELMRMAIGLAAGAEARGEVPVGAVIAERSGTVVGEGGNAPLGTCDPTAHAEIMAIRDACRHLGNYRLEGCVMVVTMEPCAMCAGAILSARIPRVVYGASDQKFGACKSVCSLFDMNFNHHPQVVSGVMEEESAALLRSFFQNLRVELRSRPKWRKPGEAF